MDVDLKVPEIGESINEVQVTSWLKAVGDSLSEDDPVVVLESDKVTLELPAPATGVLLEQLKAAGETAEVGEVIGKLRASEGAPAAPPPSSVEVSPASTTAARRPDGSCGCCLPVASRPIRSS